MPMIQCSFYSENLGKPANVIVVLPKQQKMNYREKFPVVYLLHGLMDDHTSWQRRTSLERYCDEHQLAAVLPEAGRSFYCDMVYGDAVYSHIVEEVIPFCQWAFPLSDRRESRFVAGNSMGGYGACKIALKHPELFSKVATLSGVMDIDAMIQAFPEYASDWQCCFGGPKAPEQEDLFYLLERAENPPELYQWCGTGDFLYKDNLRFLEFARSIGAPVHYEETPGAVHDWPDWDARLPEIFRWFAG